MELPEIAHDECKIFGRTSRELRYWLTPSIERKEYPRRDWVKHWSAVGWVLIVLGVMGEGWFEAQVSKYDSALSNMTDVIVAKAQKDSADAEATAKGFDAKIAESDARAKSAEAAAKKFEAEIADAQKAAAESKAEAESERLARVKLQKELQPRRLTEKQINELASRVRVSGEPPIGITSAPFDGESGDLAKDFETAFKAAGWKPQRLQTDLTNQYGVNLGMLAELPSEQIPARFMPLLSNIRDAVAATGIPCTIVPLMADDRSVPGGPKKNAVYLMVRHKPQVVGAPK